MGQYTLTVIYWSLYSYCYLWSVYPYCHLLVIILTVTYGQCTLTVFVIIPLLSFIGSYGIPLLSFMGQYTLTVIYWSLYCHLLSLMVSVPLLVIMPLLHLWVSIPIYLLLSLASVPTYMGSSMPTYNCILTLYSHLLVIMLPTYYPYCPHVFMGTQYQYNCTLTVIYWSWYTLTVIYWSFYPYSFMGQNTLTVIYWSYIPLTLILWSLCPYCHLWVSIPILSFIGHYTLTVICPHIKDGQCAHIHGLVYPYWASMPTYNCILIRMPIRNFIVLLHYNRYTCFESQ